MIQRTQLLPTRVMSPSIVATETDDFVAIFNGVAEEITGYSREEVIGRSDWRVFFEDGKTVRLQPRNDNYPPSMIDGKRINGIYRAVIRYETL